MNEKKYKKYNNRGEVTLESMSKANWYNRWTVDFLKSYFYGDILEIGCGIGNFTETLTKHGTVHAIDIEESFVKQTKRKLKNKAEVGLGDIESGTYFFAKKRFDTIVCVNVLEHIYNDSKSLKNINKLLNPGGTLILLVPAHPKLYGKIDNAIGHYRRYTKKALTEILDKSSFQIQLMKSINFIGGIGWWFAGRVLKDTAVGGEKIKLFNLIGPVFLALEKIVEPPIGTSLVVIARKKKK